MAVAACTFYAMKKGFVKPHARFGVLPGITVTGIIGCVAGSLSYKTICLERVLAIPNGTLRQQLEAMQGIKPGRYLHSKYRSTTSTEWTITDDCFSKFQASESSVRKI